MDTSKVIELGAVSEETRGYIHNLLESQSEPTTGPYPG
jgi:hypothetical protein